MEAKYPDFAKDVMNSSNLVLHELIDKVTDGDISNGICLMSISYRFPLNIKLSPLALAGSFFNYKLMQATKLNTGGKIYKRNSLPKMTYIYFTGYYSELDIDILSAFSDNVQIIMIYESSTGGPLFDSGILSDDELETDTKKFKKRESSRGQNKNLLLIPLDSSLGTITSRELYDVFEDFVFEGLRRFNPEVVLINCPFNFDTSDVSKRFPFTLKAKTWAKILHTICSIAFYRVVFLPHKIIERDEHKQQYQKRDILNNSITNTPSLYSQIWNKNCIEEYLVATLEVLTSNSFLFVCLLICLLGI